VTILIWRRSMLFSYFCLVVMSLMWSWNFNEWKNFKYMQDPIRWQLNISQGKKRKKSSDSERKNGCKSCEEWTDSWDVKTQEFRKRISKAPHLRGIDFTAGENRKCHLVYLQCEPHIKPKFFFFKSTTLQSSLIYF
jgi:hypothetical protein